MRRLLAGVAGVAALGLVFELLGAVAAPDQAQAQCSVMSRHPCTPYFCGIYSPPGCVPAVIYPFDEAPVLRVEGHAGPSEPLDRGHPATRVYELGAMLSKCLELPPENEVRNGMRVTLRLAFKRNGALLAEPRFVYVTHEAPPEIKAAYRDAALRMLGRCTPLPVTDRLGSAIAGRPFVIPIIETRQQGNPSNPDKGGNPGSAGNAKPNGNGDGSRP
jgi:hypothetical protein